MNPEAGRTGRLRFVDALCLGLNSIIGSGIFLFPGKLAAEAGALSPLAFLACGLLLSCVALSYAELGSMFRENGATAAYAREAFGRDVAFGTGFLCWATAVLSWGAVASALPAALGYFHPAFSEPWRAKALAAALTLFFGALNYRGILLGARTVDAFTAAKLLPLALFVLAALPRLRLEPFAQSAPNAAGFGRAVFLALWPLQGFENVPVPAGESANPSRDMPKAVLVSLLSAALFYALIQAAAYGVHPSLASSGASPLAEAAQAALGPWGARLLALGGAVSMTGFIAGAALGSPRYLSAVGERELPSLRLGAVHPRFQTPHRAIAATTLCALALVLALDFSRLVDLSNLAVVLQYLATCLALIVLRLRRPRQERPFRAPLGLPLAALGCLISLWLASQVGLVELRACAALLAGGYALRWATGRAGSAALPPAGN